MARKRRNQLSAPTQVIFILSLVMAIAGVILTIVPLFPGAAGQAWWLVVVGYVLLCAGVVFKNI